ncbi:MAG: NTP transferase domain-containing protein [Thaumarchaeota archaeon]|jgi:bifunctional UDP-N-acetylglucosamine pyrophosphorylase/glucosamine-1-phosphate N-acetyltransferase|nr:NTP transferase domain-containing protein [Nitrososphaerota archaeon]
MMIGLILAAGKGTRMRPYSNAINKEMSLIGESPVIEYNVKALADAGVRKAFIVLGEGKWQIFEYLRDGSRFNIALSYIYQDLGEKEEKKGTAKAIQVAEEWVNDDFIVIYGDSFFHPYDFLRSEIELHEEKKADVTMGIYMMKEYKDYGIVRIEGERVVDILEKATQEEAEKTRVDDMFAVNSGPIVFTREVFSYIKKTPVSPAGEYWITDTIRLMIKDGKKVLAYRIPEGVFWRDIGRMKHRMEAEAYFLSKHYEYTGVLNRK